jgi:hypothetical protein
VVVEADVSVYDPGSVGASATIRSVFTILSVAASGAGETLWAYVALVTFRSYRAYLALRSRILVCCGYLGSSCPAARSFSSAAAAFFSFS